MLNSKYLRWNHESSLEREVKSEYIKLYIMIKKVPQGQDSFLVSFGLHQQFNITQQAGCH
jgi:hypothetical protein